MAAVTGGAALQRCRDHFLPRTGTVTMTVNNPDLHNAMPAVGLAGGAGQLWLYGVGGAGEQLHKLDPADGRLLAMRQLSSRTDQTGVLAAGDRVVVVRSGRRLLLSDPAGTLRATVPVPEARDGLAVGPEPDAIWVADPARGGLLRVDPGFEPLAPNSATESILSRITSILGPR